MPKADRRVVGLEAGESEVARVRWNAAGRGRRHLVLTDRRLLLSATRWRWSRPPGELLRGYDLDDIVRIDPGANTPKRVVHLALTTVDGTTEGMAVTAAGPQGLALYDLLSKLRRLRPQIVGPVFERPGTGWKAVSAVAGVVCLVVGALIGHGAMSVWDQAHEPTVVAMVDSQRCFDSQSDTGTARLCDVSVHYAVAGHLVRSTMGSINQSDIYQLAAKPSSDAIVVNYQPDHVNLIVPASETTDRLALFFGAAAVFLLVVAVLCVRPLWRYRIRG